MKKAFCLVALLPLAAACRRHSVTIESGGNTVAVDGKNGQVTVKTNDGTTVSTAGFPSDVPLYPGAVLISSAGVSGPSGTSEKVATFETKDSADAVVGFYKSKLAGWKTSAEVGIPGGKMLVLQSPDAARHLSLMADSKSGKTTVKLSVGGA